MILGVVFWCFLRRRGCGEVFLVFVFMLVLFVCLVMLLFLPFLWGGEILSVGYLLFPILSLTSRLPMIIFLIFDLIFI